MALQGNSKTGGTFKLPIYYFTNVLIHSYYLGILLYSESSPKKTFLPVKTFVMSKSAGRQEVQEHRREPSAHGEMRIPNVPNNTKHCAEFKH